MARSTCGYQWPGIHRCHKGVNHTGEHKCTCGATVEYRVFDVPGGRTVPYPGPRSMPVDEAVECARAILGDPDPVRRSFALGAMTTALVVSAVFAGDPRADRVMTETLRTLRDGTPWGDAEDHR